MKATGIVRRLDQLGRIVIPMEVRKVYDIKEGDPLEIFTDGDSIVLRKFNPGCSICGETEKLVKVDRMAFCQDCIMRINQANVQA